MQEKVIFIDVDGTLTDYENQIPASAVKAIQGARANGHRVYICTGRSKAEVYEEIWEIGLDGMIGGNGCYVEHHGEEVYAQTLSQQQAREVVDWLHNRGLEFYLECNSGLYASAYFEQRGENVIRLYQQRKGKRAQETVGVRQMFPEMIFQADLYRGDVNKISFILESYQDYLDAKAAFPSLKAGTWGGKGEIALFGDLGVANVDKAVAIDRLLAYLHVDLADTFAFGDAQVDIPMLKHCAVGVAMGSGGEETKAAADYVTGDVDQDGLYQAFVHFHLIEA